MDVGDCTHARFRKEKKNSLGQEVALVFTEDLLS